MTSSSGSVETPRKRLPHAVPREHGFWAILATVVSSALSRTPSTSAWLVAFTVVIVSVALGSVLGRRIRRSAALQIAAAGALSLAGIPVQLAGGATLSNAALDACAWVAVFTACALSVRACFARASRQASQHSARLVFASIIVPLALAAVFAQVSLRAHATATLVAGAGVAAIALWRPTAKQLKPVGISLATLAVLAAFVLRLC